MSMSGFNSEGYREPSDPAEGGDLDEIDIDQEARDAIDPSTADAYASSDRIVPPGSSIPRQISRTPPPKARSGRISNTSSLSIY